MCCGDYCACIFAAVWSIIQSCFHLGWSTWGVNLYECEYEIQNKTFQYFLYLTYFYTNSCITPVAENIALIPIQLGNNIPLPLRAIGNNAVSKNCSKNQTEMYEKLQNEIMIEFPSESALADRTYNIFRVFIILDAIWIITAVGLLIGTLFRLKMCISAFFFFPWTIVLFFILILDAISAVWYGFDIPNTHGFSTWFKFIGGTDQESVTDLDEQFPKIFSSLPSIIMTIFFGRLVLVWLINFFLFFRVICAGINALKDDLDNGSIECKESNEDQSKGVKSSIKNKSRGLQVGNNPNSAAARIRRWQLYYGTTTDEEEENEEDKEGVRRHQRRRTSRQRKSIDMDDDGGWEKDNAFKYNQNLSVVGGYEGDRSNSPSPLPRYQSSSGYESSQLSGPSDYDHSDLQNQQLHSTYDEYKGRRLSRSSFSNKINVNLKDHPDIVVVGDEKCVRKCSIKFIHDNRSPEKVAAEVHFSN